MLRPCPDCLLTYAGRIAQPLTPPDNFPPAPPERFHPGRALPQAGPETPLCRPPLFTSAIAAGVPFLSLRFGSLGPSPRRVRWLPLHLSRLPSPPCDVEAEAGCAPANPGSRSCSGSASIPPRPLAGSRAAWAGGGGVPGPPVGRKGRPLIAGGGFPRENYVFCARRHQGPFCGS